jgi:hypothetical protein
MFEFDMLTKRDWALAAGVVVLGLLLIWLGTSWWVGF